MILMMKKSISNPYDEAIRLKDLDMEEIKAHLEKYMIERKITTCEWQIIGDADLKTIKKEDEGIACLFG